jgi:hypothetical protein
MNKITQTEQRGCLTIANNLAKAGEIIAAKIWFYRAGKLGVVTDKQRASFVRSFPNGLPLDDYYLEPTSHQIKEALERITQ